jgi:glyoxylase-like metal-dependent hydrolase (beta-lactamase superfamily II)
MAADYDLMRELAGVRIVPPQITFSKELALLKGDREIVVRHMAGQSAGAAWVLLPETGVVFTGDSVVVDTHPRLAEADFDAWMANLDELRKARYPAKTIVPGRGKPLNKDGVKYTVDYLRSARKKLEALAKGSRSRSEAATIAHELLKHFPVPDSQRELIARRVRVEVEHWYDMRKGALE